MTNRPEQYYEHGPISISRNDMLDLSAPEGPIEVVLKDDHKVLWVNVGGICRLRICRIKDGVYFHLPAGAEIHEGEN